MSRFFSLLAIAGAWVLSSASVMAHPILSESPMEPGLWDMTVAGTVHVPSANVSEPVHRSMQVCIKAHEPPAEPFLPAHHGPCTTTHAPLANGREQWNIHCTTPHATVNQAGWIQSLPQTVDSHWQITEHITVPARYATETTMRMKGRRAGPDCGSVR